MGTRKAKKAKKAKARRGLRRPEELYKDGTIAVKDFKDSKSVMPHTKVIKTYPQQPCAHQGCHHNAIGSGIYCRQHGGDPVILENLLQDHEIPIATLLNSKYKPEYHPIAFIALSREGLSTTEIASEFGVSVGTLKAWSEKYVSFNTAYEIGLDMHEAWWLKEGKGNLSNRSYNTGLFKFLTGNKLGYSDKIESKNLNITAGVLLAPQPLTTEEWTQTVQTTPPDSDGNSDE